MRAPLAFVTFAALALASLPPAQADACGGTFCARPPPNQPPMPVDQTGENVLFVTGNGRVEAHVQIQYSGDPDHFAWVVPMPKLPEVRPGSQQLFANLLEATRPFLQAPGAFASCASPSSGSSSDSSGCGSGDESFAASGGVAIPRESADGRDNNMAGDPSAVLSRQTVGAYEVVLLHSDDSNELMNWLEANNYDIPANTSSLLQSYLDQRYVFAAVKLTAGAGLDEIHPLIFSYEGDQPCVPLKLTAVAAKEDMAVRTFFLDDMRFGPRNYKHVVANEILRDWTAGSGSRPDNYNQLVSKAVDSPLAQGRAFVTDFAGDTSQNVTFLPVQQASDAGPISATTQPLKSVLTRSLFNPQWNADFFKTASVEQALDKLKKDMALLSCGGATNTSLCTSPHPLLLPLLRRYAVPPTGVSEAAYYGCPSCYPAAPDTWDGESFAAGFDERILEPGKHAEELVRTRPYLTRMFTTISPVEMTEDPEFVRTARADVSNQHTATDQQECDNRATMRFSNGREVILDNSSAPWPSFGPGMPAAERVEEYQADGSLVVLQDNKAAIDEQVKAFNKSKNWPPEPEFTLDNNGCALGPVRGRTTAKSLLGLAALGLLLRRWRRS